MYYYLGTFIYLFIYLFISESSPEWIYIYYYLGKLFIDERQQIAFVSIIIQDNFFVSDISTDRICIGAMAIIVDNQCEIFVLGDISTYSMPVFHRHKFIGVVGMDIPMDDFTNRFAKSS